MKKWYIGLLILTTVCSVGFIYIQETGTYERANTIPQTGEAIVFFYSPTCEPCQGVKEEFISIIKGSGWNVQWVDLSQLSAEDRIELKERYDLNMVPAIYHFQDGYAIEMHKGTEQIEEYNQTLLKLLEDYGTLP